MDYKELMTRWLKSNKELLNISGLEKAIGCPHTTLQKVLQGAKPLPNKWAVKIHGIVIDRLQIPTKEEKVSAA